MRLRANKKTDGPIWRCGVRGCFKREVSIRNNSKFEKSRVPLKLIFLIFYEWSQKSPIKRIKTETGMQCGAINTVLSKIRAETRKKNWR